MTSDVVRPRGGRLLLAADAFLFAGALDIVLSALLIGLVVLLARGDLSRVGEALGPVWGSVLSLVGTAAVVFGAAVFTWRAHGRELGRMTVVAMILGVVIGMFVSMSAFIAAAQILVRAMMALGLDLERSGPPWTLIGILVAVTAAFVAVPIVAAVRDLSGPRAGVRLDVLRLLALAVIVLLALIGLPLLGASAGGPPSEAGEAGIFMVPFALAAVFAVLGADILTGSPKPDRPDAASGVEKAG
jgi:hypothetical protein